jgi:hypothetical protein
LLHGEEPQARHAPVRAFPVIAGGDEAGDHAATLRGGVVRISQSASTSTALSAAS